MMTAAPAATGFSLGGTQPAAGTGFTFGSAPAAAASPSFALGAGDSSKTALSTPGESR